MQPFHACAGPLFAWRAWRTPDASRAVAPLRGCPVQLEAVVEAVHGIADDDEALRGRLLDVDARVVRMHLDPAVVAADHPDRVDADRWRPLVMSFQRFCGLGREQLHPSALAGILEAVYRSPDVDRARRAVAA